MGDKILSYLGIISKLSNSIVKWYHETRTRQYDGIMKLRKALRLVMTRWNITNYKLSQASGVSESTIGKIMRDEHKSASWDVVEQLANGLGKIDAMAKPSFLGTLELPDHYYSGLDNPTSIPVQPHADIINEAIKILDKNKLLDREAVKSLKVSSLYDDNLLETSLADWVLFRMAQHRQRQDKQAES